MNQPVANIGPSEEKNTKALSSIIEEPDSSMKEEVTSNIQVFCRNTTAHGWGRVVGAGTHVVKVLWLVLTLMALTCTIIHMSLLIAQYLDFSSEMKWYLEMTEIPYPSVTVCNILPMSFSSAADLLQNDSTQIHDWHNLTHHLDQFKPMADRINRTKEFEIIMNRLTQPVGYFENIGLESRLVGHNPVNFILGCTFGIGKCNIWNFTYFQSPTYYNCYTFNGGDKGGENLVSVTTGPQSGLSLILYLETDNGESFYNGTYHTLSNVGNAAGVRVMVHSQNTRPSPMDQGIDIPPGYSANVGLDIRYHTRLGKPYGQCMHDMIFKEHAYDYSTHTCITSCQQRYIMSECQCVSSLVPLPQENTHGLHYCGKWNITNDEDLKDFFEKIHCEGERLMDFSTNSSVRDLCDCQPPCEEYIYDTDLSYSYWPLDFSQPNFYKKYVLDHPHSENLKAYTNLQKYDMREIMSLQLIRKNFVRLNIYMKALVLEVYSQSPAYKISNLFSDFGGVFGLWIGMSVITWVEVVELFTQIIYTMCRSAYRKRKSSQDELKDSK